MATSTIGIANLSQCWISALKSDGLPSWSSLAKQSWPPRATEHTPCLRCMCSHLNSRVHHRFHQPKSRHICVSTHIDMEELSMTWALTWGDHGEFYGDLPIKTETSLNQTLICWFMATHCQKNVGNVWMWHDLTINQSLTKVPGWSDQDMGILTLHRILRMTGV